MRTFTIIWLGQMVSVIGSYMTHFAIAIWIWQQTNQATALALIAFYGQISSILATILAGSIVDRFSRKLAIVCSDAVAAISTICILGLYLTGNLQIWHLYAVEIVNGAFVEIQDLAYSVAVSTMVPPQHYTRASSMNSMYHYGSIIFAPALAGALYYVIGLQGILTIDLATFAVAVLAIAFVTIPQPEVESREPMNLQAVVADTLYGWRYILSNRFLLSILGWVSLFWLFHDFGGALYAATILARSEGDAKVLASLSSAAGIGGLVGSVAIAIWGGPKRRVNGLFWGMIGAGLSKIIFGLGKSVAVWVPAQFCSSLNFPMLGSTDDAIWMEKVEATDRGRVFAVKSLVRLIVGAIAPLTAGFLADTVMEPAMRSDGALAPIFGWLVGTSAGSGMALLYSFSALGLIVVGAIGVASFSNRTGKIE
jgi:MFS transporter, DHA3 family, macrolide efflux protein